MNEDKYVYENPAVISLADRRPSERNVSARTKLGLGRATICAGSLLFPDIHPIVSQQGQRAKVNSSRKVPIPMVQITPVRR